MPSGRKDRVAPPAHPQGYVARLLNNESAEGWEDFVRAAPAPLWAAWEVLIRTPLSPTHPKRQHKLHGKLARVNLDGRSFDLWQYEVTAGGRIWYCVDEARKTVWLKQVSVSHPKATE